MTLRRSTHSSLPSHSWSSHGWLCGREGRIKFHTSKDPVQFWGFRPHKPGNVTTECLWQGEIGRAKGKLLDWEEISFSLVLFPSSLAVILHRTFGLISGMMGEKKKQGCPGPQLSSQVLWLKRRLGLNHAQSSRGPWYSFPSYFLF